MPTKARELSDETHRRLQRVAAARSDVELVTLFMGMISATAPGWRTLMMGAASEEAAACTRCMWTEIVRRWIPQDVFDEAFVELMGDEKDA